jgi:type II secretory pathway predicted ATPase ExeA
MNLAHFGLNSRPFRPTLDTQIFYPTQSHATALHLLKSAFQAQDGLVLLDGDAGCGKTLVALKFLESLDDDTPRILITAPRFHRPTDLFQAILFDMGMAYLGQSEQELRLAVTEKLLKTVVEEGRTVLMLDESQHLSADCLEELRLLSNLETRSTKALFILLVAQPSLRERLSKPELASFSQRLGARPRIEPLEREEAARFIWNQLQACGGHPAELISEEALNLLTAHCHGLPRLLNQVAWTSFVLAESVEAENVDTEAVQEALVQLGLWKPDESEVAMPESSVEELPLIKPQRGRPAKKKSA